MLLSMPAHLCSLSQSIEDNIYLYYHQPCQTAASWDIEKNSVNQLFSQMLMSCPAFFLSAQLVCNLSNTACNHCSYHPVCRGGAASAGMSSWETGATWRESPMRRLPWLVTGSLASSLPSTMTTSEPSPHSELAFRALWRISACITYLLRPGRHQLQSPSSNACQEAASQNDREEEQCLMPCCCGAASSTCRVSCLDGRQCL